MASTSNIAVTGATGAIGGRVARRLAERGVPQRLIVRDVSSAPGLPGAIAVQASSYADATAMRAALDGIHTLFLVSGRETEDRLHHHLAAVSAAHDAGVERVVYLSFVRLRPTPPSHSPVSTTPPSRQSSRRCHTGLRCAPTSTPTSFRISPARMGSSADPPAMGRWGGPLGMTSPMLRWP